VRYETKALLVAVGEIIRKSRTREEIYQSIVRMANAEGVILKPLEAEDGQPEEAEPHGL